MLSIARFPFLCRVDRKNLTEKEILQQKFEDEGVNYTDKWARCSRQKEQQVQRLQGMYTWYIQRTETQCGQQGERGVWEMRMETPELESPGLGDDCSHLTFTLNEMGSHWRVLSREGHHLLVLF